jgi:hypothetical protein
MIAFDQIGLLFSLNHLNGPRMGCHLRHHAWFSFNRAGDRLMLHRVSFLCLGTLDDPCSRSVSRLQKPESALASRNVLSPFA